MSGPSGPHGHISGLTEYGTSSDEHLCVIIMADQTHTADQAARTVLEDSSGAAQPAVHHSEGDGETATDVDLGGSSSKYSHENFQPSTISVNGKGLIKSL